MRLNIILFLTTLVTVTSLPGGIPLANVPTLTLYDGQMTAYRRVNPVPQMICTGSYCDPSYTPKVMQCYNKGSDGVSIQWECKAEIDTKYKLNRHVVSCEGYLHSDDPNILPGSCGVEYDLVLNSAYQPTIRTVNVPTSTTTTTTYSSGYYPIFATNTGEIWGFIFFTICVIFIVGALVSCCDDSRPHYWGVSAPSAHHGAYVAPGPVYVPSPVYVPPPVYVSPSVYTSPVYVPTPTVTTRVTTHTVSPQSSVSSGATHVSSSYGGTRNR